MAYVLRKARMSTRQASMRTHHRQAGVCARASAAPQRTGSGSQASGSSEAAAGRREAALGALGTAVLSAASLAVAVSPEPAVAAYGESANVFGKAKPTVNFVPYAGDGYAVLIPGKWNPSKEREFTGMDMRYEDNFDAVNNMYVLVNKTNSSSIENLGDLDAALGSFAYLLGSQSFSGKTQSEGGFAENRVSTAAVLDQKVDTVKGKKYYQWEILTRTADGDEGGRHQLIKATISNGNLFVLKVQAGDKRWFKGAEKECREAIDSFTVA